MNYLHASGGAIARVLEDWLNRLPDSYFAHKARGAIV